MSFFVLSISITVLVGKQEFCMRKKKDDADKIGLFQRLVFNSHLCIFASIGELLGSIILSACLVKSKFPLPSLNREQYCVL